MFCKSTRGLKILSNKYQAKLFSNRDLAEIVFKRLNFASIYADFSFTKAFNIVNNCLPQFVPIPNTGNPKNAEKTVFRNSTFHNFEYPNNCTKNPHFYHGVWEGDKTLSLVSFNLGMF